MIISPAERKKLKVSNDYIKFRGGKFKFMCSESVFVQYIYYGLGLDILMNRFSKSYALRAQRACEKYLSKEELNDDAIVKSIKEHMFHCLKLCKVKPEEYFLYKMRGKSDDEIRNYISDSSMMEMLSKTGARHLHNVELNEKCNFYKIASTWFKRRAAIIESKDDYSAFVSIVKDLKKVIVKPASVGCGSGIFIYEYTTDEDLRGTFNRMMEKGSSYIAEELIVQGKEMASWNPSSVNTLRINTYKNKKGVFNHVCFIRTGRPGAFVDNAGQGGVFAVIDDKEGKIASNGFDENGNEYIEHPNSKIVFKGWTIPNWGEVLKLAKHIHEVAFDKHPHVAWDFAQNANGDWVLLEGNWGQFVCQQIGLGHGVKSEILELLK